MSETDHGSVLLERRPACDNCKTRKTKCDRRSPCASCVTLNVACRSTRRAPEKRQRVALSSKYDEAVQDVSRQLGDVKEMLQALMLSKDSSPHSAETSSSEHTCNTLPPPMIDEQVPSLSSVHEGFNGDSSFQSHAHGVQNVLEATLSSPQAIAELLHGADTNTDTTTADHAVPAPLELGNLPLPPLDVTLKLLRLVKVDRQRFFVDLPIFDEDELVDRCRGVYFATEPVSIWTWIIVNVGLYYLFSGASPASCKRMGVTPEDMRLHGRVLKANAEAAMQSLRLCSEPSMDSCRALALLGTFYIKEGHTAIAWRMFSTAARACLDLGFHRLPNEGKGKEITRKREVFWYIYIWERGLAITCGRTPTIHQYDRPPRSPALVRDPRDRVFSSLYLAFHSYAILAGEIQQKLFSASARNIPQEKRVAHVRGFAARIMAVQESIKTEELAVWGPMFDAASALIEINMYSLLALVYRILPPSSPQFHPLQCADECVDAARSALSSLLKVGEEMLARDPAGWSKLLNVVLSLAPFVSFTVLVGNAIATSSSADLALLSSIIATMAPVADDAPNIRKIHDACKKFSRVASLIVSSTSKSSMSFKGYQEPVPNDGLPLNGSTQYPGMPNDEHGIHIDYVFPMAQQDWDSVMTGFESELGEWDSRALTSTIEPYIANTEW
ncbi:hypothetical protein GGR53DRAFT_521728 [Hypoxylon sp. FL1150]|nr:hypothetical protein GGR53DRAFT_521728 [Hypoxylon sp. FL1150]